jgi:REP element-mobilizing transposase RayT
MKQRRSVRLRGYDYRHSGAYYVTICVHPHFWRRDVFGRIRDGVFCPNRYGRIVESAWDDLPNHHQTVSLDAFVVMPNHLHAVIVLTNDVGDDWKIAQFAEPQADSLGLIVGALKAAVTREVRRLRGDKTEVWQRSFYEHIVRDEKALDAIRRYIVENPANWDRDELNAEYLGNDIGHDGGHDRSCPYSDAGWKPEIP